MGRPPSGPGLAERLDGPEESKRRLKTILETISGDLTVDAAARELGIGAARFHELRREVLQGALAALAPRPMGRPPIEKPVEDPRVAELEEQVEDLKDRLEVAQVREQLARAMPHLHLDEPEIPAPQKKRKPSKVLDQIRESRKRPR